MNSKSELRRLGGLESALKMLESPKPSVVESAVLVIANCTQADEEFCVALLRIPPDKLRLLVSFLGGASRHTLLRCPYVKHRCVQ